MHEVKHDSEAGRDLANVEPLTIPALCALAGPAMQRWLAGLGRGSRRPCRRVGALVAICLFHS